ncbi:FHA domain-containing protein [Luteimonas sp. gir]|uniref:FHA domain-containing protein n=1 Tax=Luteimonas sp. gir TaxID=3127960 RepID=UPI003075B5FD
MTQRNDNPTRPVHQVLRIVDGLHAGASRVLGDEEMILVGSGEDCDIVLADDGVASHHALVTLVGGRFLVRALDAPVQVGATQVEPGDPVELATVQPVRLGEAAIAFGREDDPDWDGFVTVFAPPDEAAPRRSGFVRRLPLIAGIAALSLASLAIFAAVLPGSQTTVDPRDRLDALLQEHRVTNPGISDGVDGRPSVTGAVDSAATLERLRAQLQAEGIAASLQLRTGENIAADVAEMFRGHGIPVKARYTGNGDVEVVGEFEDGAEIERLARSRAVSEISGVARILPRTPDGQVPRTASQGLAPEEPPPHIVSIVRGEDPHLIASDGRRFVPGDELPGKGRLISIGASAHVLNARGDLVKITPGPVATLDDTATASAPTGEQVDPRFTQVVAGVTAGSRGVVATARNSAAHGGPAATTQ